MAQGNVEVWLGTLLEMSRKSVHHVIRTAHTAVQDQGFNLLEFLSTFPAQVLKLLLLILKGNDWQYGWEEDTWGRGQEEILRGKIPQ